LRLQAAREEERIRIARELHDGLGSMLTGIEIGLTWMRTVLEGKVRKLPRRSLVHKIVQLDGLICDTTVRVRELCTELRPSILDDLGLIPAIEWQAREFEDRTGIRCEPKNEMEEIATTPEESTAVFRIFQEILTNVARHAHASRVHVSLKKSGVHLELEVKDNGIGIRPEQLSGTGSLGLVGMQERAGLLGGDIRIDGHEGKGTTVLLRIPLAPAQAGDVKIL
jgi:signal transduction histidine kinase